MKKACTERTCTEQSRSSRSGLTLVEVLVAAGIASVVGVLLLAIIVNSAGLFYKQSSKIEQGLGANDALAKIRTSIKEAQSIASGYPESSPIYTSGATQLVLKLASLDSSGNIISSTFDYFVFFLDQAKLRFKVFPATSSQRKSVDQIFSTNVSSLEFKYLNSATPPVEVLPTSATKVKITLSLKQKSGGDYEQSVATSEAFLRND